MKDSEREDIDLDPSSGEGSIGGVWLLVFVVLQVTGIVCVGLYLPVDGLGIYLNDWLGVTGTRYEEWPIGILMGILYGVVSVFVFLFLSYIKKRYFGK